MQTVGGEPQNFISFLSYIEKLDVNFDLISKWSLKGYLQVL